MNHKLKLLPAALAGCLLAPPLAHAGEKAVADTGKVSAELKSMVVLDAADNGYDPSEGWAYMAKLKYETASWNNTKMGMGYYSTGDFLNQTNFEKTFDDPEKKLARGMFVTPDGEEKSLLGEFYLQYNGAKFGAHGGRQMYATPLTTIAYSTMPNFHTVFGINTTALSGFKLSFDQVTQMSFGARTATDFGLIGEGTQTAGSVCPPQTLNADGSITPGRLEQAKFYDINTIATCNESVDDTNGISVLGASYTGVKGLIISAWDYYADDISNTFYLDGSYGIPLAKGLKINLLAQYLSQSEQGSLVEDNPWGGTGNFVDGIDYRLFGLKAVLKGKQWMAFAAYNKSTGDTGMYNSWGGDPAYTSSIFSRNAYRENVSAYKIGAKYDFMKNLFVMLSHADYGQSDSIGRVSGIGANLEAQTDAKETDLVLVYKPVKNLMLKMFHARRTSEYDGSNGKEAKQAHTRLIASYNF